MRTHTPQATFTATSAQTRFICANTPVVVWLDEHATGKTMGGLLAMLYHAQPQGQRRWLAVVSHACARDHLWRQAQALGGWVPVRRHEQWRHEASGLDLLILHQADDLERCRGICFDGIWLDDVWERPIADGAFHLLWHRQPNSRFQVTADRSGYPPWLSQLCGIPEKLTIPWTPLPLFPERELTLMGVPKATDLYGMSLEQIETLLDRVLEPEEETDDAPEPSH